jgi:phosphate starvation-inducible PhoH-like protein
MKMFLTRLGFGSKVIVTGDTTQKDLAPSAASGLEVAQRILKNIDGICFITLTSRDVVRHPLVQKIVKAYEEYDSRQRQKRERRNEPNNSEHRHRNEK